MADSTKASAGCTGGTVMVARAAGKSVALGGDDHRRRLVGPVDGQLLGHVVGVGRRQAGGADQDQRLGGQVDVLLVLGGVAGDRLVGRAPRA